MVPDARGIPVDAHLRAGERLWAIGDVTGLWPLTHVGKYQAQDRRRQHPRRAARGQLRRGAARRLHRSAGRRRRRHRGQVRRDRAPVGRSPRPPRTARYAESNGYLTLLSDGERLTGAHALGPEAGEWLQQATLAIRARVPLDVLADTIQPFPTFSEIYLAGAEGARTARSPRRDGSRGWRHERPPGRHRRRRLRRTPGCARVAAGARGDHAHRPAQLPPVPAADLPGRDRRAVAGRGRVSAAGGLQAQPQRARAARRGRALRPRAARGGPPVGRPACRHPSRCPTTR